MMNERRQSDGAKILALQGMRGIAALVVTVAHATLTFSSPAWFQKAQTLINAQAAVTIFFVLSGYVLTLSLRHFQWGDKRDLFAFYVKRIFRFYPALLAATGLALIYFVTIHRHLPIENPSVFFQERFPSHRFTILHVTASFAGALAFLVPPAWSIFVEIVASAFMPLIAWLAYRRRNWFWISLAALVALSLTIGPYTYYGVGRCLAYFMMGAALYVAAPALGKIIAKVHRWRTPLLLLVTLAISFSQWLPAPIAVMTFFEACCACAMTALIVHAGAGKAVLESRPALYLGEISYSIYLLHFTVLSSCAKIGSAIVLAADLPPPGVGANIALAVITIAITLPLAHLLHRYVEAPGIDLGRRAVARIRVTSQAAGAKALP